MKTKSRKTPSPTALPPTPQLIDMPEAIKLLKTTRPTFYRWVRAGKIKAMKVGRQWRFQHEDLERFLKGETPRIGLSADITPLVQTLCKKIEEAGGKKLLEALPDNLDSAEAAVALMIAAGMAMKASDLHITSHFVRRQAERTAVFRCRVDGVLHPIVTFDLRLLPAIAQEWKRRSALNIHEKEKPQDGRIELTLGGQPLDIRVNILPSCLGESVTARVLDPSAVMLDLNHIPYAPQDKEKLQRTLKAPNGVILVTGPTGSGKTTALYSCLNEVAGPEIKAMSIEDPVEYLLPWVTQVRVNPAAGVTFGSALRAMLRADPDVILVGEIRDFETLMVVQQAALTGHLVLTTLHTDEAAGALKRMVDIGSNPFLIADSTKLILAQRLVRRLCPHCSIEAKPSTNELDRAAELARQGGLPWESLTQKFRKPVGCEKCVKTGYRGRTVIAEVLEVTPEIGKALRNNASVDELRATAVQQGMTTMIADGIRRAANGETSLAEVFRTLGQPI